jgi:galactose mutarotase-like enzyme
MTTCGLRHAGQPEVDDHTGEARDLHGRYSRLRAGDVAVTRTDETLTLRGTISEGHLFNDQLRLQRTYTLNLREAAIHVHDLVTNLNDTPVPLMLLYHINVGFPLLSAGAVLHTPQDGVYCHDDDFARSGLADWPTYGAAEANRPEQVYYHHVKTDSVGQTQVLLQNGDFGFQVAWDAVSAPYFTQWKNTRRGMYVSGIEPGNCIPEGQNSARQSGRLQMLAPGQEVRTSVTLSILDGADAVAQARARIDQLRQGGKPSAASFSDLA